MTLKSNRKKKLNIDNVSRYITVVPLNQMIDDRIKQQHGAIRGKFSRVIGSIFSL